MFVVCKVWLFSVLSLFPLLCPPTIHPSFPLQQQVLYLSSRLDEVKGELSECQSREVRCKEELKKVKGELEGKSTLAKTMEAELQHKQKALEQTRSREDKMIHKLQQVSTD